MADQKAIVAEVLRLGGGLYREQVQSVFLAEIRDELRRIANALESGLFKQEPELEPDAIVCPHCGNSDPEKLEYCGTSDAPNRWFCKNTACARSFVPAGEPAEVTVG